MGKTSSSRTIAIVVSYNSSRKLDATLAALSPQLDRVIVVDNGSGPSERHLVEEAARNHNAVLIKFEENKGIGAALNRGVEEAVRNNAKWILTMDQDTVVSNDFMMELDRVREALEPDCCFTPYGTGLRQKGSSHVVEVGFAITSGNLLPVKLLADVGPFREDLFIDGVDIDFSLRLRMKGYRIFHVPAARIKHDLGDRPTRTPFHSLHSPLRRYYMARNHVIVVREYFSHYPFFIAKLSFAHIASCCLAILLGPLRRSSFIHILKGTRDGLRGRTGAFCGR
ncbi:glycosyltransferase family 2 protein [Novosphingobium jiangmenense]|uniref:Glycosyltransferase family 2 protein n=1 Tax=Novosphingobium jiangmenense TaxID=2791981 RepID=A0ABS0HIR4_9SPHN|nr:glycosyltransferase family 2 protein [Novosphingobium jiangmenense]MBF9152138.1 glycosyltransferase family 2 protein [Novosphingobium jiangmenense]